MGRDQRFGFLEQDRADIDSTHLLAEFGALYAATDEYGAFIETCGGLARVER